MSCYTKSISGIANRYYVGNRITANTSLETFQLIFPNKERLNFNCQAGKELNIVNQDIMHLIQFISARPRYSRNDAYKLNSRNVMHYLTDWIGSLPILFQHAPLNPSNVHIKIPLA